MNLNKAVRLLALISVFFLLFVDAFPQVLIERSNEKVIISGIQYYMHHVRKGETAYSISRAYGLTVAELQEQNPTVAGGINEGQILRITVKDQQETKNTTDTDGTAAHDDTRFLYHTLSQGETLYSLSRKYGVKVDEITGSNPGIDITKLPVGTEVAIPRSSTHDLAVQKEPVQERKSDADEKKYFLHKVQEGETLSSIAAKYNITLREIRRQNRDARFPQPGDYIKIPGIQPAVAIIAPQPEKDTVRIIAEETPVVIQRTETYSPVKNLNGKLNVAVMLPFYLPENSMMSKPDSIIPVSGKNYSRVISREEELIYPRSLDFIEMYQGILLAADTLSALGLDINLHVFDIRRDSAELKRLINSGTLSKMDLIIGPVYSRNLAIMARYATEWNIPVVSPVSLQSNSVLSGNPNLFLGCSTMTITQRALAKKVGQYNRHNIVFIHADSTGNDPDVIRLRRLIKEELNKGDSSAPNGIKEITFRGNAMFDVDSGEKLARVMSETDENIVVIASEDAPVISKTLADLHNLRSRFNFSIFGYTAVADNENLDPKYLFDLGVMVFSPSKIDYGQADIKRFNTRYRQVFLTQPVEKSYAWQGYDLAYYFISGLAGRGKAFINNPQWFKPDLLQTDFNFIRNSSEDGFENQKLYLVKYQKDYNKSYSEPF